LLLFLFLGLPASAQMGSWANFQAANTSVVPPTASATCNIVTGAFTGVGGPGTCIASPTSCNGTVDDAGSFGTANSWAQTWQSSHPGLYVEFLIPSGYTCTFQSNTNNGLNFTAGINELIVSGYGATLTNLGSGSNLFNFGISPICQVGLTQSGGCSARTATVSVGATAVFITDTSYCSRFTPGLWATMTGFDLQGLWNSPFGYPPNLKYYDYVKVTSTTNCASTGEVDFAPALTHSYESTWPNFNSGDMGHPDAGGPATLYAMTAAWDQDLWVLGVTIDQTAVQTTSQVRNIVYKDVTVTGSSCIYPSQNVTWSAYNATMTSCNMEADKLVGTVVINGSALSSLAFQTGDGNYTLQDTTVTGDVEGTPQKISIINSHIGTLAMGATGYGRTDEVDCTNSVITTLSVNPVEETIGGSWTMTGGVITIPNTASAAQNQERWAAPQTNVMWHGPDQSETMFNIVDVRQDATNIYIQTSSAGGFPAFSPTSVLVHPAPKYTFTGCTGDAQLASVSQAAPGSPIYSYQTYTYTGAIGANPQTPFDMWGNLSSVSLNVTNAYTGAGTLNFDLTQFGNWPIITSANTEATYGVSGGPSVNAKIVGNRVVTLSGVTGGQSGDCLTSTCAPPDATVSWFAGTPGAGSVFSADASGSCPGAGCPSVTVTIQTDQGVIAPTN
jgi:hypothetical protein